jgi:ubiquinone/menaquinone biosynthesis C-methylase UbiE
MTDENMAFLKRLQKLGLSAEAALAAVGPTGQVTAADVSPAMAEKARDRLAEARNASVLVEDGTSSLVLKRNLSSP